LISLYPALAVDLLMMNKTILGLLLYSAAFLQASIKC